MADPIIAKTATDGRHRHQRNGSWVTTLDQGELHGHAIDLQPILQPYIDRIYNLEHPAAPGPGPSPSPSPTPTPTPTVLPVIEGHGSRALGWLDPNGPKSYFKDSAEFWQSVPFWGTTVHHLLPKPDVGPIKIVIPNQVNKFASKDKFFLDARGVQVDMAGGCLWFEPCTFFAIANFADRAGWNPALAGGNPQDADGFTFAGGSHDYAFINMSVSGAFDENFSSTRGNYFYTYQDTLCAPTGNPAHNYGSLNDYLIHEASLIRTTWIDMNGSEGYRNPKIGYYGDAATGAKPSVITAHIVNRVNVNCFYTLSVESGSWVRDDSPYEQTCDRGRLIQTGGILDPSAPVAAWAMPKIILSPIEAARYAKLHSGRILPDGSHDAFDTSLLAKIAA